MLDLNQVKQGTLLISVNCQKVYGDPFIDKVITRFPIVRKLYNNSQLKEGDYIKSQVNDLTIIIFGGHKEYGGNSNVVNYSTVAKGLVKLKDELKLKEVYAPYNFCCSRESKADFSLVHSILTNLFDVTFIRIYKQPDKVLTANDYYELLGTKRYLTLTEREQEKGTHKFYRNYSPCDKTITPYVRYLYQEFIEGYSPRKSLLDSLYYGEYL